MKRLMDLLLAILVTAIFAIPILVIAVLVRLTSKGPVIYWSDRVGRHNKIFPMPKFRTMRVDTPAVATHLLTNPGAYVTSVGRVLRHTSLDELPQLWSIFRGDMSFVGPRPALFNQDDLVALRTQQQVDELLPGLTGWAQVNGRDDISIPEKVRLDVHYLRHHSMLIDLQILGLTVWRVLRGDGISG